MLEMRFSELYFQSIKQKYVINLSVCRPSESIQIGQMVVNCLEYYKAKMAQYDAVPISEGSSFYYLSNFNGQVGYLGLFPYLTENGAINLFIEITARYEEGKAGYPDSFSDYQPDDFNIPQIYSYAKYHDGRLVLFRGRYDYPMYDKEFDEEYEEEEYDEEDGDLVEVNNLVIPFGVTKINTGVFALCPVVSVTIPESVESLSTTAFDGCGTVYVFGPAGSPAEAYCRSHGNCVFVPVE